MVLEPSSSVSKQFKRDRLEGRQCSLQSDECAHLSPRLTSYQTLLPSFRLFLSPAPCSSDWEHRGCEESQLPVNPSRQWAPGWRRWRGSTEVGRIWSKIQTLKIPLKFSELELGAWLPSCAYSSDFLNIYSGSRTAPVQLVKIFGDLSPSFLSFLSFSFPFSLPMCLPIIFDHFPFVKYSSM